MAASDRTVEEIVKVISKHVDLETMQKIVAELLLVPGNQSFRDTIQKLAKSVRGGKR